MCRAVATEIIENHGVLQAPHAGVANRVASALDSGADRERLAKETEHLGHEGQAFKASLLIQRREDLGRRPELDPVACSHRNSGDLRRLMDVRSLHRS